jgi:hypothetical protein
MEKHSNKNLKTFLNQESKTTLKKLFQFFNGMT